MASSQRHVSHAVRDLFNHVDFFSSTTRTEPGVMRGSAARYGRLRVNGTKAVLLVSNAGNAAVEQKEGRRIDPYHWLWRSVRWSWFQNQTLACLTCGCSHHDQMKLFEVPHPGAGRKRNLRTVGACTSCSCIREYVFSALEVKIIKGGANHTGVFIFQPIKPLLRLRLAAQFWSKLRWPSWAVQSDPAGCWR